MAAGSQVVEPASSSREIPDNTVGSPAGYRRLAVHDIARLALNFDRGGSVCEKSRNRGQRSFLGPRPLQSLLLGRELVPVSSLGGLTRKGIAQVAIIERTKCCPVIATCDGGPRGVNDATLHRWTYRRCKGSGRSQKKRYKNQDRRSGRAWGHVCTRCHLAVQARIDSRSGTMGYFLQQLYDDGSQSRGELAVGTVEALRSLAFPRFGIHG